jgi:hypothetical protein
MSHAKSLRVIGLSLEAARIATFELEKYGPQYMVWSDSVTKADEWILRNALRENNVVSQDARHSTANRVFCFSPADISRLDSQAQKQRRNQSFSAAPVSKLLSDCLRTLGDHFDRLQVHAFRIEWTVRSVTVDYQRVDGQRNCRTFTAEELQHLCAHPRLLRSRPYCSRSWTFETHKRNF